MALRNPAPTVWPVRWRSVVTSLEHNRTDIMQHLLLTLCNQRAAHAKAPPLHLANTDRERRVVVVPILARLYFFLSPNKNS